MKNDISILKMLMWRSGKMLIFIFLLIFIILGNLTVMKNLIKNEKSLSK